MISMQSSVCNGRYLFINGTLEVINSLNLSKSIFTLLGYIHLELLEDIIQIQTLYG
jgi:hypothetical protein